MTVHRNRRVNVFKLAGLFNDWKKQESKHTVQKKNKKQMEHPTIESCAVQLLAVSSTATPQWHTNYTMYTAVIIDNDKSSSKTTSAMRAKAKIVIHLSHVERKPSRKTSPHTLLVTLLVMCDHKFLKISSLSTAWPPLYRFILIKIHTNAP